MCRRVLTIFEEFYSLNPLDISAQLGLYFNENCNRRFFKYIFKVLNFRQLLLCHHQDYQHIEPAEQIWQRTSMFAEYGNFEDEEDQHLLFPLGQFTKILTREDFQTNINIAAFLIHLDNNF